MDNFLQQGINAAKAGDKARAFQLLTRAIQDTASAEQAWLWMSSVVSNDSERLFCLDNALRINPDNAPAKNKAAEFRQKGIFPAVPISPDEPSVATPPPMRTSASPQSAGLVASPAIPTAAKPFSSQPVDSPRPTTAGSQQDFSGLYRFAAQELANKKSPKAVAQKLTEQGVTPATANQIVAETQKLLKKALSEKNKKRMLRGFIWLVIGIVLTCGTLAFASSKGGGTYVVFYGAIIWGIIDFIAGFFGWLFSQ